ncbi:hypothetical protein DEU56DRAFT_786596 [Suillus clintonianus]|uniref:uncharacterized protein n=1 Tax=Suillus clintonianus TaxID=1904413 RepID=UPI001B86D48D|nr:uncharacterized protein DEU56DRAFT_786596 [Suillus clintonianus]KAG2146814.1 hypothetical protein DEU56DRAFT_786596 [Suillus clintonianus]
MSTSAVAPAFNRRVVEIASMLSLQAPGANAHFDMLEEWGRDVALFFTWLHTKEHKEPFTLTAVSNLRTTFQDQVDTHRHLSWLSWGRLWLPLTVEASRAALRALIVELDIEDPLASHQQSPPAVATVPELSNNSKGKDRATPPAADHSPDPAPPTDENDDPQDSTDSASSDDGGRNKEIPARTSTPRAKRPREPSPQVDARPSNDQTHSSPASRSSKRPRLSGFRTLRLSHKGRSSGELMHHYDLRDPCEVAHKCKRCTAKPSAKPCVTILRQNTQTSQYVLSERCLRCLLEKRRCEWPAGAVVKNTERRVRVKSGHSLLTEDLSVAPKGLESVLGQSSASAHQVVSNLAHRNTVKATSSTGPAPGPSSATATKRAKHTSHSLPQLPTLKAEDDLDAIDVHACPYFKPEAIDVKIQSLTVI